MDERYFAQYRDLYERHWWWRSRERFILDALLRESPPHGWERILDVGCGDGLFFDRLAAFGRVEGVDPAANTEGPWSGQIHVVPFDASFNPGRRYSLILFLDVLEHLDRPVEALRTAAGLLHEGGAVLITVPALPHLWTRHDDLNQHRTRYTRSTLTATLDAAGFNVADSRYFFHWLAAAKLVLRGWEGVVNGEPTPPRVPRPVLNRALEIAAAWEARLLGPLHLPFGSSLMALAHKRH